MSRFKIFLTFVALLILISLIATTIYFLSLTFYMEDDELALRIKNENLPVKIEYWNLDDNNFRILRSGRDTTDAPLLLMIHGSPGSSGDFLAYLSDGRLRNEFSLLAADRIGYGGTGRVSESYSIRQQAEIIMELLSRNGIDSLPVALLSHSYGSPVAALIAGELQDRCIGHVMVAPVLDPDSEKVFWYSPIPLKVPFSLISSIPLKRASVEKIEHIEDLKNLKSEWTKITSPTIHIHGSDDWLAPIDNIEFCKRYFPEKLYRDINIENGSHFILWSDNEYQIIINELLKL